jgi:hypothetical protein
MAQMALPVPVGVGIACACGLADFAGSVRFAGSRLFGSLALFVLLASIYYFYYIAPVVLLGLLALPRVLLSAVAILPYIFQCIVIGQA